MKRTKFYGVCSDLGERVYMAQWGKYDNTPVAARLIAARCVARLNISSIAKLLHVDRSSVWRWESGYIESMSIEMVKKWALNCDVPYQWIIDGGRIRDQEKFDHYIFQACFLLSGRLKPLPDSMGLVSTLQQRKKHDKEQERRRKELAEDAECDRLAEIQHGAGR